MREEGNSHQPLRELLRGEEAGLDATRRRAELGEDPGRESKARTILIACLSPARKLCLERRKLFPARAVSGTEASGGCCAARPR